MIASKVGVRVAEISFALFPIARHAGAATFHLAIHLAMAPDRSDNRRITRKPGVAAVMPQVYRRHRIDERGSYRLAGK
jgi:hypothetical protein